VGGEDAADGDWPWMVTVYPGNFLCGGSLIDENTVLTAAHCLYDDGIVMNASDITVVIGEYTRTGISSSSIRSISDVYVHSDYDPEPSVSGSDIALLKLSTSFTDSTPIGRVDLDSTIDAIADEEDVTVLGWGSTVGYAFGEDVVASFPDILQEAEVPLKKDDSCTSSYGNIYDSSTMLCAGEDEGGTDACQGDSGGPLIYNNGGNWEQIGIVSFGSGCATAGYPGVYTRLAAFDDWIESYFSGDLESTTSTSDESDGVSVDNDSLIFDIQVNGIETQFLLITNDSSSEVNLNFELTGDSQFTFDFFDDTDCTVINSDSSCPVLMVYTPTSETTNEATFTIDSDLDDTISIVVSLSGTSTNVGITTSASSSSSSGGGSLFFVLLGLPLLWVRRTFS